MLSLGKYPSQPQCCWIIHCNSVSKRFLFPTKTHLTQFSSSPNGIAKLDCCGVFARKRTGFCIYASKSQRKGGNDLLEMDGLQDFDENDDFLEEEEEGEEYLEEGEGEGEGEGEDDDDEEEFIPLHNMKKWLMNKPRGFGEGRVYDTSIEDKLMEEIEQSRRAQLTNINRLKNNPVQPKPKKERVRQEKECKDGFRVRLVNLPKKKNIHRDLRLAFNGVPGIIDIVPVVSGNRRTRDPICKGVAFISFRTENDANRFVQSFTGQNITFGKVQKQIKCEMATGLRDHGYGQFDEETTYSAQLAEHRLDSSTEDASAEFENQDEMHKSTRAEDDGEDLETQTQLDSTWDDDTDTKKEYILKSSAALKKEDEMQEKKKKVASRRKKKNIPTFNIPGSANRLKTREKEVLTGVFSKYGANASLATREQS